jgi:type II secretory ATPase GspE/PulE/Tfp pilus assembly ATPase PilB-like protein
MNDLLISEIRDDETGRAFMDLAGSGTNLYTTTHTGSVILIPDRLCSDFIGVSRDFLATPGVLKLLVFQALLPKLCSCSLPLSSLYDAGGMSYDGQHKTGEYWRRYGGRISNLYNFDADRLHIRNEAGCKLCNKEHLPELNGFMGRTVVAEMAEPGTDDEFLQYVRRSDNVALRDHFMSHRSSAYDEPLRPSKLREQDARTAIHIFEKLQLYLKFKNETKYVRLQFSNRIF